MIRCIIIIYMYIASNLKSEYIKKHKNYHNTRKSKYDCFDYHHRYFLCSNKITTTGLPKAWEKICQITDSYKSYAPLMILLLRETSSDYLASNVSNGRVHTFLLTRYD